MNKQKKIQVLKGFRDFLPQQAVIRNKVKEILVEVFESYGFEPLETPTLEYQDVLLGKYGEETELDYYTGPIFETVVKKPKDWRTYAKSRNKAGKTCIS